MAKWYPQSWNDVPETFEERDRFREGCSVIPSDPEHISSCIDQVLVEYRKTCAHEFMQCQKALGIILEGFGDDYSCGNLRAKK